MVGAKEVVSQVWKAGEERMASSERGWSAFEAEKAAMSLLAMSR